MLFRVKSDANEKFLQENPIYYEDLHATLMDYEKFFEIMSGRLVEADTSVLMKYAIKTKPIPGVINHGIIIDEIYIDEIFDDVRYGKAICYRCEEISDSLDQCTNCGADESYLSPLKE